MSQTLKIKNRDSFLHFLNCLANVSTSSVLNVTSNIASSLVSTSDNTLILYGETAIESEYEGTLNIPDVKKLHNVLSNINDKTILLKIHNNSIEYRGMGVKFKYHLYEDGLLTAPNLNVEKIKSFNFDVSFPLSSVVYKSILKGSTFATETDKIYFYTQDNIIRAELTDKAKTNTDSFTLSVGEANFDLSPIAIKLDNLRLVSTKNDQFDVNINTEYGVVVVDTETDDSIYKYVITSLVQ